MDLLKTVSGFFERRFLMNALLPSALFWGLLAILVLFTSWNAGAALSAWDAQTLVLKSVEAAAVAVVVLGTAGLLTATSLSILRFFEGYWPHRPALWVGKHAKAWHQRRLKLLTADNNNRALFLYPPDSRPWHVMPTQLGNILKAGEVYATLRYGLDAVLIWPRLWSLLPEEAVASVITMRSAMEFHLAVAALATVFAVAAGAYLLIAAAGWTWFLACFWGGLGTAWISYEASLPAAIAYSDQVRAIFDNWRNALLKQMRLPLPANVQEERALWGEVGQFLLRNAPATWQYEAAAPTPGPTMTEPPPTEPASVGRVLGSAVLLALAGVVQTLARSFRPVVHVQAPHRAPPVPPPPVRPIRARRIFVVGAALVGAAGALYLGSGRDTERIEISVPAHDLAEYAQIGATDLKCLTIARRSPLEGILRQKVDLVGRYPLAPLRSGQPISSQDLGPQLPAGTLRGVFIAAIPVGTAAKPNPMLAPGKLVTLVSTAATATEPIEARLLSATKDGTAIVVAVPTERRLDLARICANGCLTGVTVPP